MKKTTILLLLFALNCANPTTQNTTGNTAYSSNGSSIGSAPTIPTGLRAVSDNQQITLTWTAQNDATSFNVYYNTLGSVNFSNSTKYPATTNTFTHYGLTNGMTYYYVVTSVNAAGESTESTQVQSMAGLMDNHNGSIYVSSLNQTWAKCSDNYYNAATDSCNTPGLPTHMYCAIDLMGSCDNGTFLTSGDTWTVCNNMTTAGRATWRVPTVAELQAMSSVSTANPGLFGVVPDWHWATNAMFMQVSLLDGTLRSPIWRYQIAYVECVSDGI